MAATDARPVPRKNIAYRVTFPILDADGDLVTAAAALDSEVSIDGGTFADATSEATEIATSSGVYFLDLTAAEMNGDTIAVIVKTTTTGAKTTVIVMYPEEVGDYRADVVQISGDTTAADNAEAFFDGTGYAGTGNTIPTVTTLTNANPTAAAVADAVWDEDATGHQTLGTYGQAIGDPVADTTTIYQAVVTDAAGATIAADIIAIEAQTDDIGVAGAGLSAVPWNAAWDAEVQSEAQDALNATFTFTVAGDVDANVQSISDDTTAADRLEGMMDGVIIAQVNDAAATTTVFIADGFTEATNDHFNGRLITFLTGALALQQTDITDYVGATQTLTVTTLTEAPANNDFFVIH